MSAIRLYLLMLPILLCTNLMAAREKNLEVLSGQMRFNGEIVVEACNAAAEGLQMGQISRERLNDSGAVDFNMYLENCTTELAKRISLEIKGIPDKINPNILSINEGPDSASGIGIILLNDNGGVIPINHPLPSHFKTYDDLMAMNFAAKYQLLSHKITYGKANALAWIALSYD